jgi:PAS domain-containing protein
VLEWPNPLSACPTRAGTGRTAENSAKEVTVQKPNRRLLRAAERIFSTTDEAAALMDSRFVVLALNDAHRRTTGYGPDESIGQRSLVVNAILARRKLNRDVAWALSAFGIWQGEVLIPHRTNGRCRVDLLLKDIRETSRNECSYLAVFSEVAPPATARRPLGADRDSGTAARHPRSVEPQRVSLAVR